MNEDYSVEPLVHIHPWVLESIGNDIVNLNGTPFGLTASAVYPLADLAFYVPFLLCKPVLFSIVWCHNGTAVAGNVDIRIYDASGVALTPSVQAAQVGINAIQTFVPANIPWMGPGLFYIGIVLSNAAGRLYSGTMFANEAPGVTGMAQEQLGVGAALPNNAAFASITGNYIPNFGVSTRNFI
jgi:hypothetical protein